MENARSSPAALLFRWTLPAIALLLAPEALEAARISDWEAGDWRSQAMRFLTLRDASLRTALLGSALLGINCGLLGGFVVVRGMALLGDTLSHAILPGIVIGFLVTMTKNSLAIFLGASLFGLLGVGTVSWITRTTRLKRDAALGIALSSYYALGICLLTMLQRLPSGKKSGVENFLFGQAAAMSRVDVGLLLAVSATLLVFTVLFYRHALVAGFDENFGRSIGLPVGLVHGMLMALMAFSVVVSVQAVGIVLVSAALILPASAAYLLVERFHRFLLLSAFLGAVSALAGVFFSFLGNELPTGPVIALSASVLFALAFLFSPRHGWLAKLFHRLSRRRRVRLENLLKAIYRALENRNFQGRGVSCLELSELRGETIEKSARGVRTLLRGKLAFLGEGGDVIYLYPKGFSEALRIVRNHRLWELYLTNIADYDDRRVHSDAEEIEHILGEETVRKLEKRLDFPRLDPHGKPIPGLEDIKGPSPLS